ncbi:MAG TPA: hypothetical protein PLO53_05460 [Candidatus Hydrogenedentes bacterium]|nr:hypothetical protein [Candidatus Hydrogenedentota bacterium]
MTDVDPSADTPDVETPRRLYNKPDSWIDLHPAGPETGENRQNEPPRFVVLERKVQWSGNGCAGCVPGCLMGIALGFLTIGISVLWMIRLAIAALLRLFGVRR